jgi:ABC-type branched-subunit amino acid transport system substrate-binding protein
MMLTRSRWRYWTIPAVAVLAAAVTACGASTQQAAGGDAGSIKFRTISAEGSGLTNYPDVDAGARAAIAAINAKGGINGKKIEYSFCNTKGDANQALTCARQAVTDKVTAVVGGVEIYTTQSTPILEKGNIPIIGNVPISNIDGTSSVSYPLHAGNDGAFTAAPLAFQAAGKKKMAIIRLDFAATAAEAQLVEKVAKAVGMPTGSEIVVPAEGVTDYTPYVQQVKDQGADATLVMLGPAGLQGVYKAGAALGVQTQFADTVFSFGESEARAVGAAANGVWALSPYPSPRDTTQPAVQQFNADLTAAGVAQNDASLRRSAGLNAWLSVQAAAAVAGQITGTVTAASMTDALKKAHDVDVAGLVKWSPANLGSPANGAFPRYPVTPYQVLTFKDGQLVATGMAPIPDPIAKIR